MLNSTSVTQRDILFNDMSGNHSGFWGALWNLLKKDVIVISKIGSIQWSRYDQRQRKKDF